MPDPLVKVVTLGDLFAALPPDMLYVAQFESTVLDTSNLRAMVRALCAEFGGPCTVVVSEKHDNGFCRHLAVLDLPGMERMIERCFDLADANNGRLDQNEYEEVAIEWIQAKWLQMSGRERFEIVEDAGAPWEAVLDEEPRDDVQVELYRMIDP